MKRDACRALKFIVSQIVRYAWREIKSKQILLLVGCLLTAVTATTTVSFFIERVEKLIQEQSNEMLAADLRISSYRETPDELINRSEMLGLKHSSFQIFSAMVTHDNDFILADVKAVDEAYPLRGALRGTANQEDMQESIIRAPQPGELYVDSLLMAKLKVGVGDKVVLGNHEFVVARILTFEPDRGTQIFNIAHRAMINIQDVPLTGLVVKGSRVSNVLLLAGDQQKILAFRENLSNDRHLRIQTIKDVEPNLKVTLDRAERFMRLSAMIALLISICGIAFAAHEFARSRWDMVAIMRTFGASKRFILLYFSGMLLCISVACGVFGSILAYGAQALMIHQVRGLFTLTSMPGVSLTPAGIGILTSLFITLGFALPSFVRLRNIAPMRVLRRDIDLLPLNKVYYYLPGIGATALFCFWQARSLWLGLFFFVGFLAALFLLAFIGSITLKILGIFAKSRHASAGIKMVYFRKQSSLLQIIIIGFGLTVMLLLMVVRTDLINIWKLGVARDAPNHFAVNIPDYSVSEVQAWLEERGVKKFTLYPMFMGRITRYNQENFDPDAFKTARSKRLARRQYNLSWSEILPDANKIIAGRYENRSSQGYPAISIEEGVAKEFHFKIGDLVDFSINGEEVRTEITSIRTVDWQTVQPNFFILFNAPYFNDLPMSWITAFYWPPERNTELFSLVRAIPEITLLDVGEVVLRAQTLIDKVTIGVSVVFSFSLIAAVLIFLIIIQATKSSRVYEIALYRTFGLTGKKIRTSLMGEFMIIGAVSGLIAGIISIGFSMLAMWNLFDMIAGANFRVVFIGFFIGMFGIGVCGYLSMKKYINVSPMRIIRNL